MTAPIRAAIATVHEASSTCRVLMLGVDGGAHQRGPYPYTPRPGADGPEHPTRGDACCVVEDTDGGGWVVAWTPT